METATIQLGYTQIRSPLDGRMGRSEVRVGSLVGRLDSTLLATVSTVDPMYVNFSVSEREALSVWRASGRARRRRLRHHHHAAGRHRLSASDGRLDFVDRAVDPRTGTLALRATFPNPARVLRPGQYVRLRVLLEERPDALLVPQAAIQESQGSTSLFVVGPDQTVQARAVRMGPRVGPLWVVEDGVKPGEHVVVKGLQQVRAGHARGADRRGLAAPRPGADAPVFVNFFIDRPIFASVLAIVIVVAGAVAIPFLPIAMFPEITPPQVVVTATYPGASAEVVEQTVTTPIEQQVNGVENMIYMSSRSGSDGTMTLTVTFKVGTDLDIAAVNVQNRVAIAQAKLPR